MKHRIPVVFAAACSLITMAGVVYADTLTYLGVPVREGSIDGNDLTGQTAAITIEFADGLTAGPSDLSGNMVFDLGPVSCAVYEFSDAGLYVVDLPQDNLEFGSPGGFELSFYDEGFDPLAMLSGATAGDIGMDPIAGETLGGMFSRLGDGSSIGFVGATDFQMLNVEIGTLNGGASTVTQNLVGLGGSTVALYLNRPGPCSSTPVVESRWSDIKTKF